MMDDNKVYFFTYLYLLEGYLESEWFVVIRIKSAFLDRRFLLLQSLSILHQRDLNVRIWEATDVHLLQIFSFQNNHRELSGRWYVSQRKAYVTEFIILQMTKIHVQCIFKVPYIKLLIANYCCSWTFLFHFSKEKFIDILYPIFISHYILYYMYTVLQLVLDWLTCPPSPSTLCSSLHSSIVCARSIWQSGTFTSPIWSCFENLSKSKMAKTRVLFIASA